ncbi:TIGR04219 family outer membrane beta-barrel protein [Gilvimarinus agarilyticus]|uniref:TIGR04219 family outer membrane beta-barrel protein n=1 Tax=unclassified Gilvimarinus TaxID=2642066 RepID=UPI001C08E998|nr:MULTISPECIES: TIGR04219 family outer membrane beta-barrel protein [unclassified Gilvimarinus]MBU2885075.1 TIGR04219 family outer membrane beta-barrel protein [Gilvimarinus agarilyticus]MDO6569972.1 TIGR04219 family outer membrane beta-barrel protein [Gilvimarinus sp. 2_MG-2023]MDO6747238.1 TIGR04219 family outer membrane beta-barrel protein [Gilvimarinus sp. 1_MG-2023]
MQWLKIGAVASALVFSPYTLADFIGAKGEAGVWRTDYSGDMGSASADDLGFNQEDGQYARLYVEHPVPLIPNARVSYADISSRKSWELAGAEAGVATINLTHVDVTAYYELLDNWVHLDAGLSLRHYDGEISVAAGNLGNLLGLDSGWGELVNHSMTLDDALPMGYVLAAAELPFTGWSAGVEINYTEFNDYTISDNTFKVRYLFDAVVDLGFEAGYRQLNFTLDKGFGVDLNLSGPFAGFAFHF